MDVPPKFPNYSFIDNNLSVYYRNTPDAFAFLASVDALSFDTYYWVIITTTSTSVTATIKEANATAGNLTEGTTLATNSVNWTAVKAFDAHAYAGAGVIYTNMNYGKMYIDHFGWQ